ncbi:MULTISPECIES: photosynthetic complex putative assembly protein PuhB [Ectothiorhodospira]|uniref:PH domain-containing protein n=1 Tax=Ectothiorhodospira marina TaxID=1396821 RepID=A0A1H7GAQ4_9GAMM|nr:photosynthetic complex putative assembly protein PuhB [Ectothiorhodospira marina]SEK35376.1 PH domain-containing protein [Ectothiorhodospira marina]
MSHDDHAVEPIRGLPELPPSGERILWQGAPHWSTFAIRAFHVRKVIFYLAILIVLRAAFSYGETQSLVAALASTSFLLTLSVTAVGLLMLLAWLTARATVYTITNQRIVMRFGVALQMSVNLPYSVIESASAKLYKDGTGDIPLVLIPPERVSYIILWPHVRPWRWMTPQPMLRGIPNARRVADILAEAMAEDQNRARTPDATDAAESESAPQTHRETAGETA